MPKIYLKPKSPEFESNKPKVGEKICDMPGCQNKAEHRAPKDRSLDAYWNLCLDHAREYNKAWNYFVGMSDNEIYESMYQSSLWDRPTFSFKEDMKDFEDILRDKAWRAAKGDDEDEDADHHEQRKNKHWRSHIDQNSPEGQALTIMGLEPPITLDEIKSRYKALMKEHHPDLRRGDKESEELVKKVNMSYTILKMSFQKFEKMTQSDD